nr:MAG TPA: hypothetical protein [Caudoviricetes sp.]
MNETRSFAPFKKLENQSIVPYEHLQFFMNKLIKTEFM